MLFSVTYNVEILSVSKLLIYFTTREYFFGKFNSRNLSIGRIYFKHGISTDIFRTVINRMIFKLLDLYCIQARNRVGHG